MLVFIARIAILYFPQNRRQFSRKLWLNYKRNATFIFFSFYTLFESRPWFVRGSRQPEVPSSRKQRNLIFSPFFLNSIPKILCVYFYHTVRANPITKKKTEYEQRDTYYTGDGSLWWLFLVQSYNSITAYACETRASTKLRREKILKFRGENFWEKYTGQCVMRMLGVPIERRIITIQVGVCQIHLW